MDIPRCNQFKFEKQQESIDKYKQIASVVSLVRVCFFYNMRFCLWIQSNTGYWLLATGYWLLATGYAALNIVSFSACLEDGRAEIRNVGTVLLGQDESIEIGDFFVSELMTCIVLLSNDIASSPIESIKPSCSCVSAKLSGPSKKEDRVLRELLFEVKRNTPGPFHSKITFVHEDGHSRDVSLRGEIKPIFEVIPKTFDLNAAADLQIIEINCLQNRINLKNALVSIGDDRFVISAIEKETSKIRFQLAMSPEYKPTQLLSTRELMVNIQAEGRLMTIALTIKHKPKPVLVPSTLSVDEKTSKPVRLYLLGSKANVLKSTGRARVRCDAIAETPLALGSFHGRTEDSGVFEFEVPWKDFQLESNSNLFVEFEVANSQQQLEWITGGSVVVYFHR